MQARLVAAAPLAGAWGTERSGFAEVPVMAALEGLPGADACAEYVFVEERGPWEAEAKRLDKEVLAHSKHKQRVSLSGTHGFVDHAPVRSCAQVPLVLWSRGLLQWQSCRPRSACVAAWRTCGSGSELYYQLCVLGKAC